MSIGQSFKDKDRRKRFAHIVAGVVILIHSFGKFDSGHENYILFGIAGIIFLLVAYFHPRLEIKFPWVDGVFFIIEGILSILISYEYFHAGKKALPVVYAVLSLFQFFMAFKNSKKGIEHSRSLH